MLWVRPNFDKVIPIDFNMMTWVVSVDYCKVTPIDLNSGVVGRIEFLQSQTD